jgi:hypothetical protein
MMKGGPDGDGMKDVKGDENRNGGNSSGNEDVRLGEKQLETGKQRDGGDGCTSDMV